MMIPITANQIRALRAAANSALGPCNCREASACDYHSWLFKNFGGITSTKDLSNRQAREAIDILRRMANYQPQKPYTGAGTKGFAGNNLTQQQARKIGALENELGWNAKRTRGFIRHTLGKEKAVEWLLIYEAQKVITGMERVLEGGYHK